MDPLCYYNAPFYADFSVTGIQSQKNIAILGSMGYGLWTEISVLKRNHFLDNQNVTYGSLLFPYKS